MDIRSLILGVSLSKHPLVNTFTHLKMTGTTYREIRDIDRQGRVNSKRTIQRAQPRPRHRASRKLRVLAEKTLGGGYFDSCPDEHGEPCSWNDEGFDEEEPADALGGDEQERELLNLYG